MVVANYLPEIGSAAHIYYDLTIALVNKGHDVDVITSYPREFYLDKKDRSKAFPVEETINGINVHRYKSKFIARDNLVLRGLEHYWLPVAYYNMYKKLGKKFDVCLIYIPPLPLYYFARQIKKRDGTPSVLNIQDFHPEELVDVGVLKNKLLIKLMEHIERESFKNADYITVMSKAGVDFITARVKRKDNIECIYNSIDPSQFDEYPKTDFKAKENITDKLLVTYAGIISPFQGLDDILDTAILLKDEKNIIFYIIGDGMGKENLLNRVRNEGIENVRILPLLPRNEYLNAIASSDINIVTLDKRMSVPVLPGKFINLLGVKKPIIANVPAGNDIVPIVNISKCGIVTQPGAPGNIAQAITMLSNNPRLRSEYGLRGCQVLDDQMNIIKNVVKYENIFLSLKRSRNNALHGES